VNGNGKIITYLTQHYQMPQDFAALVYLTQVLQAEAMRIAVEHWRRQRDRCSGTLYWQLNDCWPVASWSSIDYYGRWKALHYAARRFYAPLLLSVEDHDTRLGLYLTNDTVQAWSGQVKWSLESFNGDRLAAGTEEVTAAPLMTTSVKVFDFVQQVTDQNRRDTVFVCELWRDGKRVALTTTLFMPDKHMRLEDPQLETQLEVVEGQLQIRIGARSLARFIEVSLTGSDSLFSDNYFDLPAGETVTLTCSLPEGWTRDRAQQALRLRSLRDSH